MLPKAVVLELSSAVGRAARRGSSAGVVKPATAKGSAMKGRGARSLLLFKVSTMKLAQTAELRHDNAQI